MDQSRELPRYALLLRSRPNATKAPHQDVDVDLAPRELQVLQLIADGRSTKQIASTLHLSESTVKTHLRSLFEKLGASHRAHAVALAIRYHLID